MFSFKDPQGQIARWLEVLAQYGVEIQHREGRRHLNADALSRKPSHGNEDDSEWTEFKEDVDDVVDLGNKVRAVTRSKTKESIASCSWIDGYSTQEMSNLQNEDSCLKLLHKWADNGAIPSRDDVNKFGPDVRKFWINWQTIERINNVLYMKRILHDDSVQYLLLVPEKLRKEVLDVFHSSVSAGHFGVSKTTSKI